MKAKTFSSIMGILKHTQDEITFIVRDNKIKIHVSTPEIVFIVSLWDDDFTLEDGEYTIVYQTLQQICKNIRSDAVIKIKNSVVNECVMFEITNGFRTVMYQCSCHFNECNEIVEEQPVLQLPLITISTIDLKDSYV